MSSEHDRATDLFLRGANWSIQYQARHGTAPSYAEALEEARTSAQRYPLELLPPPVPTPAPAAVLPSPVEPAAVPAPKKNRAKKEARPAGWSEGAWAYHMAARGTNTYAAMTAEKINDRAMRSLDKSEVILPNDTFRATLWHIPQAPREKDEAVKRDAAGAALKLAALTVDGSAVHFETEAESRRKELICRLLGAHCSRDDIGNQSHPDPLLSAVSRARDVAREALAFGGLREHVRMLMWNVRWEERKIFDRFFGPREQRYSSAWIRAAYAYDSFYNSFSGSRNDYYPAQQKSTIRTLRTDISPIEGGRICAAAWAPSDAGKILAASVSA